MKARKLVNSNIYASWYLPDDDGREPIVFDGSPDPTLGMELELMIVDPETGELAPGGPAILERFPDVDWLKPELLQSTVELNLGPCDDIAAARASLQERFDAVREVAADLGYGLLSAGTHPYSTWESQAITEKKRYQQLLRRMRWPVQRLMIFGLHVHVGVPNGERAIAISNALTSYIPHLLALSASSPFWRAEDTGLASVRVKIFETMPTAGLPYRMINWGEFQRFMNTLVNAGAIETIREVWWDIRPHPIYGTVEVRVCDALPSLAESLTMAALVQCLVVWLGELYERGEQMPLLRHWIVAENKWRACRWADEATIICSDDGDLRELAELVSELVERLEPIARRLDCHEELLGARKLLETGPSYRRQRQVYDEAGSYRAVVRALEDELYHDTVLS